MRNLKRTLLVTAVTVAVCGVGRVVAQDWPQWRGPNRDGKAAGFVAPKVWPTELTAKWRVTVGEGVATPALVGERLYVFSRQEGGEIIRCLEAATGKELWQDKYDSQGATGPSQPFSGPRSSPTVADGKVVTLGIRGVVSCWDATSGKLLWRKDDFQGATPRFFTASSPLVTGGLAIVQLGGNDNGGVIAYDLASGAERWRWSGDGPGYASPVLLTLAGTTMIVAETDKKIVGLNAVNGKLLWEVPFAVSGRGYNASTPIVSGNTLIYCGSGRGANAMQIAKTADGFALKELWKNPDNSVQFNTPVLKDDRLYGLSADNNLFCVNANNGQTVWVAPLPRTAGPAAESAAGGGQGRRGGRPGFGSVVDAGPVLMALSPESELVVFRPNQTAFSEVARIKVAPSPTYAHPVISGNRLVVKDQDAVMLYTL